MVAFAKIDLYREVYCSLLDRVEKIYVDSIIDFACRVVNTSRSYITTFDFINQSSFYLLDDFASISAVLDKETRIFQCELKSTANLSLVRATRVKQIWCPKIIAALSIAEACQIKLFSSMWPTHVH